MQWTSYRRIETVKTFKFMIAWLLALGLSSVGADEASEAWLALQDAPEIEVSQDNLQDDQEAALRANIGHLFTYQGRLTLHGEPASGLHEYRARLYDQASGGSQIGPQASGNLLPEGNGLFTLQLDFGAHFAGAERWLELDVRPFSIANPPAWTTLSPRQRITPAPAASELANDEIELWVMPFNAIESDGLGGLNLIARASGTLEITNSTAVSNRFIYIPVQIPGHFAGRRLRLVDARLCYEVEWASDPSLGLRASIAEWNVRRARANTTSYSSSVLVNQTNPGTGAPTQARVCETVSAIASSQIDGALFIRLHVVIAQQFYTLRLRPMLLRFEAAP
ncbi:MAG: hypothetical protein EA418_11790 [Wenzhouxiangellaceae bacterium]|nr:MAG: hypothetical protein EA418_11790 [Wenzhouxiangellaceae bacterium]